LETSKSPRGTGHLFEISQSGRGSSERRKVRRGRKGKERKEGSVHCPGSTRKGREMSRPVPLFRIILS
jgi:hypothetical protein